MELVRPTYQSFSELLEYPDADYKAKVAHCWEGLGQSYPREKEDLGTFVDYVKNTSLEDLQELYTRTFEVQAICQLDVGYVLFGEDYKRGEFLVHMQREHKKAGIACGTELPDHLCNVMKLLAQSSDPEFSQEFIEAFMVPALEKMLQGFKEKGNVYAGPLRTLQRILFADISGPSILALAKGSAS